MFSLPRSGILKDDEKDGTAWIAGNADWPMLLSPTKPNAPLAVLYVIAFQVLTMFGYICPTYSKSEKMNVFFLSKPQAIMSLTFSVVNPRKYIKLSPFSGSYSPF